MMHFPRVWLDDDKSWAREGFSPEAVLGHRGYVEVTSPTVADVIVVGSVALASNPDLIELIGAGTGLVVLPSGDALTLPAGVAVVGPVSVGARGLAAAVSERTPAGLHPQDSGAPQDITEDLLARVDVDQLIPTSTLALVDPATPVLRLPGTSRDPGAPVAATSVIGDSRVVVLGVVIDGQSGDLLFNAITY